MFILDRSAEPERTVDGVRYVLAPSSLEVHLRSGDILRAPYADLMAQILQDLRKAVPVKVEAEPVPTPAVYLRAAPVPLKSVDPQAKAPHLTVGIRNLAVAIEDLAHKEHPHLVSRRNKFTLEWLRKLVRATNEARKRAGNPPLPTAGEERYFVADIKEIYLTWVEHKETWIRNNSVASSARYAAGVGLARYHQERREVHDGEAKGGQANSI